MPDGSPRELVPDGFRRVEITRQGGDVYGAMVFLSSEQLSQAGINPDRTEYIFIGPSDGSIDIIDPKKFKSERLHESAD